MFGLLETTQEWKDALAAWPGIQDKPPKEYRKRSKGFPVLKNAFMEKWFGTSHWAMPGVWFIPVIVACLYLADTGGMDRLLTAGLFFAGVLGWTLVEYILHRWLFHLPPMKNPTIREIQYVLHGYHHEFPDDPGRVVAPPALSWPLAILLALFYWAVFGEYTPALYGGTVAGYLAYDWMHYYTHHGVPNNAAGKFMRRFHLEHHFKTADGQFGLSSPLWDYFLGTFWTTNAWAKPSKGKKRGSESSSS